MLLERRDDLLLVKRLLLIRLLCQAFPGSAGDQVSDEAELVASDVAGNANVVRAPCLGRRRGDGPPWRSASGTRNDCSQLCVFR